MEQTWTFEIKKIAKLAFPVSTGYFLQTSLGLVPILFIGRLGTDYLAAAALATMFANVTGISLVTGMATALDTLCSQAHTGSSDPHALGKHLQRGFLIVLLVCIPVVFLWFNTTELLIFAGQDAKLAHLSGQYLIYMIPGLFPIAIAECLKKYLQAQAIMNAPLFILIILSPINVLLQYLLVLNPSTAIGFLGAPLALSIAYYFILLSLLLYIRFVQGGKAWGGFDFKEMFNYRLLWEFTKLGFPGCLMMCSEWWAFEIMALLAGILGKTSLAAQSVLLNTGALAYMIPLGIGVSSSTLIGNALGAGDGRTAQIASRAALGLGLVTASVNCLALILLRKRWGYLWDDDQEVANLVETVLPLVAFFQLSDSTSAIGGGILRGAGKQKFGAIINLVAYYAIGIPLGLFLTFPPIKGMQSMGLFGLWVGLTGGVLSVSIFQVRFILFLDWNQEVANAKARLELENDGYAAIPWAADEEETHIDDEEDVFHDSV